MSSYRTRFSQIGGSQVSTGVHPSELWGVSSGPRVRKRGDKARARRRAKRAAKRGNVPLKAYLRSQEKAVSR